MSPFELLLWFPLHSNTLCLSAVVVMTDDSISKKYSLEFPRLQEKPQAFSICLL